MMNRKKYFDYIEGKLMELAMSIRVRGGFNILDYNTHCESFYPPFLNMLFDWKLENLNNSRNNAEAIDLIDYTNKIIVQVSSTDTKQKVETTLSKSALKDYSDYTFKFISIATEKSGLKHKTFSNPHGLVFTPANDVLDIQLILNKIISLDEVTKQKSIYNLIKAELGGEVDFVKYDSNIAIVINILSKEDLNISIQNCEVNAFEIDIKIEYNQLNETKSIIDDYSIHHSRLDKKYQEFDKEGSNKSYSVLQLIRNRYIEECKKSKDKDADYIFMSIIENVKSIIINSANYVQIPIDELELCVGILVVDAFIRCKVFKNPGGYNHASS